MTVTRKTPLGVLKQARKLIAKPESWTQGDYRCQVGERNGKPVFAYCAMGAIEAAIDTEADRASGYKLYDAATTMLSGGLPPRVGHGIITFNDRSGRTHAQVLALFDRAIAKAEKAKARKPRVSA